MLVNKGNYYNEINGENTAYSNLKKEIIVSNCKDARTDSISNQLDSFLLNHSNALIELITQTESLSTTSDDMDYSFTMIIFYREPKY
ncbi:unnamed protein product [marine sediment metagenome]|uniref:Uncharacterized protein n=1 Tax=marine sediment metagenome TaxID=412755 RepID=X0SJZ3_9ZZZZ